MADGNLSAGPAVHLEGSRLERAIARIDEVNSGDPRTVRVDDGEEPTELLYGRRMSGVLEQFEPRASEALRLAVRAQHIARWRIPRDDFPRDRAGYKRWRTGLMQMHADLTAGILREVGYDDDFVDRVGQLIRKQGIKRDPEAQTLEDVACLVFLKHHLEEFAADHEEERVVDILRKTWVKMSARGQDAALQLRLTGRGGELVAQALAG